MTTVNSGVLEIARVLQALLTPEVGLLRVRYFRRLGEFRKKLAVANAVAQKCSRRFARNGLDFGVRGMVHE
jgi:hypothetical protein